MTTTTPIAGGSMQKGLGARFAEVRSFTERLAAPLSAEDQTVQTMPDVSPTKWHRAHTTWFFETFVLAPHRPGHRVFDESYRFLFNSYYEAVGPRHARPERGFLTRPGVTEIAAYRRAVDAAVGELLAAGVDDEVAELVELGLHHEQQHQELLLMDIKNVLGANPLQPAYLPAPGSSSGAGPATAGPATAGPATGVPAPGVPEDGVPANGVPANGWVRHPGGIVDVGHPGPERGFHFDNESPRHQALLAPFAIASGLVSCGDWMEFMADGGYERPDAWMSDGWAAVRRNGWEAPEYWSRTGDGWALHTLYGTRPVERAEPVVHVSWYEADAFARWAGARLPTEAEWEVVATERTTVPTPDRPGARFAPGPPGIDVDGLADGGLHPAASCGRGDAEQWYGAAWQWTADAYAPYPGFRPASGAVGEYNGKFMVNQQVLRGGACVTPAGHTRPTYRNFFYPASRWPFCGLRLAVDDPASVGPAQPAGPAALGGEMPEGSR